MEDPKEKLLKFVEEHKGELVLECFNLVRLLGFHEDEDDYYYRLQPEHGKPYCCSCLIWITVLKGKIDDKDYEWIEKVFNMNMIPEEIPREVFVGWDSTGEMVTCVHESIDGTCEACEKEAERIRAAGMAVEEKESFIVKP